MLVLIPPHPSPSTTDVKAKDEVEVKAKDEVEVKATDEHEPTAKPDLDRRPLPYCCAGCTK